MNKIFDPIQHSKLRIKNYSILYSLCSLWQNLFSINKPNNIFMFFMGFMVKHAF